MKRYSWKYLAGLIDGEGCVDVQVTRVGDENYIRPRLRLGMSDVALELLKTIQLNHGGSLTSRKFDKPEWSNATCWELVGYKQVCMFLRNIVNSLVLKKEQVRFILWMETNIKGKQVSTQVRDAIREELKLMKRDQHRLSEKAQERNKALLCCDSRN